jgi:hypothetical protein
MTNQPNLERQQVCAGGVSTARRAADPGHAAPQLDLVEPPAGAEDPGGAARRGGRGAGGGGGGAARGDGAGAGAEVDCDAGGRLHKGVGPIDLDQPTLTLTITN